MSIKAMLDILQGNLLPNLETLRARSSAGLNELAQALRAGASAEALAALLAKYPEFEGAVKLYAQHDPTFRAAGGPGEAHAPRIGIFDLNTIESLTPEQRQQQMKAIADQIDAFRLRASQNPATRPTDRK